MIEPCATEYFDFSKTFTIRNVTPEAMVDIVIPNETERLVIVGDYLDELVIPDGIVTCICPSLGLRRLVVPDSVEFLYCNRNNIRELELPERMYAADVSYNPMYDLHIRGENPELGKIKMTGLKIKKFHAKVKPECEIDMEDNPHLTSLSREVQYAAFTFPYREPEYKYRE